eukprot:CAMPEP_0198155096 /NCGR_PEP_ID=MMETSP1443-20131203/68959_1 /TAXON_ID=186043 /ORGANISM="Entomoneis sp., Strain CCMP2396" /LENGTH=287 /DNA_ID=CAMNT_0043821835 /DNA_START=515 /DNA_END=1375 /DNA_ORIENTATION=+
MESNEETADDRNNSTSFLAAATTPSPVPKAVAAVRRASMSGAYTTPEIMTLESNLTPNVNGILRQQETLSTPDPKSKTFQFPLDKKSIGKNTPRKGIVSRHKRSDAWDHIMRLKGDAKIAYPTKTHVCRHCLQLLTVYKNNNQSWQTSVCTTHLTTCTGFKKSNEKSKAAQKSESIEKAKKQKIQAVLAQVGTDNARTTISNPVMKGFSLISPQEKALAQQAGIIFMDGNAPPKSTFDDPEWRSMMTTQYVAGGGRQENAPILKSRGLKRYLEQECNIFKMYIQFLT